MERTINHSPERFGRRHTENQNSEQLVAQEAQMYVTRPKLTHALQEAMQSGKPYSFVDVVTSSHKSLPTAEVQVDTSNGKIVSDNVVDQLRGIGLYGIEKSDIQYTADDAYRALIEAPPLSTTDVSDVAFVNGFTAVDTMKAQDRYLAPHISRVDGDYQVNLAKKMFAMLPSDLKSRGDIFNKYQQLIEINDFRQVHQAFGAFTKVLTRNVEGHFFNDVVAPAWEEILMEKQIQSYLKNPIQATMLIAELPVHEFSEELRTTMLEHPNASHIKKVFDFIDKAMKPALTVFSADFNPMEQSILMDRATEEMLSPQDLQTRIELYREMLAGSGRLRGGKKEAFLAWKMHIKNTFLNHFNAQPGDFAQHVTQHMRPFFDDMPADSDRDRVSLDADSFSSQVDELIVTGWGLNKLEQGEKNDPREAVMSKKLLYSFPVWQEMHKQYLKGVEVSSYPWLQVFSEALKESAHGLYEDTKGTGVFGDIEMSPTFIQRTMEFLGQRWYEYDIGLHYKQSPIKFLYTLRDKEWASYARKGWERGEIDTRDLYGCSVVLNMDGYRINSLDPGKKATLANDVIDFLDLSMQYSAAVLDMKYIRTNIKIALDGQATAGGGASGGGYGVIKYSLNTLSRHPLDVVSNQPNMEVCFYPSVADIEKKKMGGNGVVGDLQYAEARWSTSVPSNKTYSLKDLCAPRQIFTFTEKTKKNINSNTQ